MHTSATLMALEEDGVIHEFATTVLYLAFQNSTLVNDKLAYKLQWRRISVQRDCRLAIQMADRMNVAGSPGSHATGLHFYSGSP